jgi:uncharacterized protein (TIGR03790 family)
VVLKIILYRFVCALVIVGFQAGPAWSLKPNEVLVVANQRVAESVELAQYYMGQRGIPKTNLLLIDAPKTESCSRRDYEQHIATPVRDRLIRIKPAWRIRCLVTVYGLPLKIDAPVQQLALTEASELNTLLAELMELGQQLQSDINAEEKALMRRRIQALKFYLQVFERHDGRASVDSELALVRAPPYPLSGWIPNPFCPNHNFVPPLVSKDNVLMVSRLDGPDASTVRRIIDDTLIAESKGLRGIAYFDARYPYPQTSELNGYQDYDRSIHQAARVIETSRRMPVVLDEASKLFQPGEGPQAALYCGWYSLGRYVDAFEWQPGAVAYHIASRECATLKNKRSRVWCKMLLDKGAAVTIGPVNEPFVQAFPPPERFFWNLTDGYLTLAECYLLSLPHLSWKMVLIGDPLYRPFGFKAP